jgi:hypothetical protein
MGVINLKIPDMKKTLFLLLILPLFIHLAARAQNDKEVQPPDKYDSIRNAEPLFFYGLDFSCLRISDGSKVAKSNEYGKVFPRAWITFVEKEILRNGYIERALRKRAVNYKQDEIISVSLRVVPDFIIARNYSFPIDTIKNAVKKYELREKSGIGFVFIPENFNKRQEKAMTWFVFFDIRTREVLWATEVGGKCGHAGYTAHWGTGIVEGFKYFVRKIYRKPLAPMYDNY